MVPSVAIALDVVSGADPKWKDYYVAGSVLSGQVLVTGDGPIECEAVRCVISWHTEGRGDRNEEAVWSKTLHEGPLTADASFPFEASLPVRGPISYSGHYINVVWTVTAIVDLVRGKDPQAVARFFVLPAPYVEAS